MKDPTFTQRIKHLEKITTPFSPDWLETNIYAKWRKGYYITDEQQKQSNEIYENFYRRNAKEDYFNFKQLEEIGLDADVYICLTKRNCGKTYSYMRLIAQHIERGEEFVIVRNSLGELNSAVTQQFRDYAHFYKNEIVCRNNKIYERITYEQEVRGKMVPRCEDKLVGYMAYLSGKTQIFQGSSYPKVKTVIWDEATNAGKTSKETQIWNWAFGQLVVTFFRGKKNTKMYILGNLMNTMDKDGNMRISDQLITDLGIDPEDNFKYRVIENTDHKGEVTNVKLMYINTRDLYNNGGLNPTSLFIDQGKVAALAENRPTTSGQNIVGEIFFILARDKMMGIQARYANKNYVIQVAVEDDIGDDDLTHLYHKEGIKVEPKQSFYIIRVCDLNRSILGFNMPIYTDDPVCYSTFNDVLTLTNQMPKLWGTLSRILKGSKCVFVGDRSYNDLYLLLHSHKHYIEEYEKDGEKKVGKRRKRGV